MRPQVQTKHSAGADLCSSEDLVLLPGQIKDIGTGYYYDVADVNMQGEVRGRSGMAFRSHVHVLQDGTIDSDYKGEVRVVLKNSGTKPYFISKGDRIAQLVITPCCTSLFFETNEAERLGGFGSTSNPEENEG